MSDLIEKELAGLRDANPPAGLNERIMKAVGREARRQRVLFYALEGALALAVATSVMAVRLVLFDLSASPMRQLLGLAWTDWRRVVDLFGDWALAVMESAPFGSLALALGALFASIFLLERIIRLSRVGPRQIRKVV